MAEGHCQGPGKGLPSPKPQSIYSRVSPSWHSEPGPFLLRGLWGKRFFLQRTRSLPRRENAHCSVRHRCLDTAVGMQRGRRPLLPGNPSRAQLLAHTTGLSFLLRCLALYPEGSSHRSFWDLGYDQGAKVVPTLADSESRASVTDAHPSHAQRHLGTQRDREGQWPPNHFPLPASFSPCVWAQPEVPRPNSPLRALASSPHLHSSRSGPCSPPRRPGKCRSRGS